MQVCRRCVQMNSRWMLPQKMPVLLVAVSYGVSAFCVSRGRNVTRVISWRSYRLPSHARTPRRVARWSHEDTQTSSRAVPRNRLDGQRVELKRSSPPSCSSPLTPKSCRRMKRGAIVTQRREKPGAVWLIRLARGRFWSCAHVSGSFNRTRWLIVAA